VFCFYHRAFTQVYDSRLLPLTVSFEWPAAFHAFASMQPDLTLFPNR
jgi:hypothetical protein